MPHSWFKSKSFTSIYLFTYVEVVVPSNPYDAKGLLLASIRDPNPVIFFEPKLYYRSLSDEIPEEDYEVPLGKANILQEGPFFVYQSFSISKLKFIGTDITVVGWGAQIQVLKKTMKIAQEHGFSCELIDLRTLLPWDKQTVIKSVKKTGRLLVSHEAPRTCGLGAEIAQTIQEECFTYLEVCFCFAIGSVLFILF